MDIFTKVSQVKDTHWTNCLNVKSREERVVSHPLQAVAMAPTLAGPGLTLAARGVTPEIRSRQFRFEERLIARFGSRDFADGEQRP